METGVDIMRAWVSRMIMLSLYRTGKLPFKDVYLHGMVNDEHNQKMSKSKGNVINPMEMVWLRCHPHGYHRRPRTSPTSSLQ